MSVYCDNLSTLSADGENLKDYLHSEFSIDYPLSNSLNVISIIFGWENWSAMSLAHGENNNKNSEDYIYWSDLRLLEKTNIIKSKTADAIEKIKKDVGLKDHQDEKISNWLISQLAPNIPPLPKNLLKESFLLDFINPRSYKSLHPEHFREGIEYRNPDTLTLTNHLKDKFLKDVGNPGCIVYCEPANTIDFARAFTERGYDVSLFGDSPSLKNELNIESKNLVFFDEYNRVKSDENVSYYIQDIKSELVGKKHFESIAYFLDFYLELIKLRLNRITFSDYLFCIPSLKEVVFIWENESSEYPESLRKSADLLLNKCLIEPKKRNGTLCAQSEENYQCTTSSVTEQINELVEHCKSTLFRDIPIWRLRRPSINQVYLFPVEDLSSKRAHQSRMNNLIMNVFANEPLISSANDIFVFSQMTNYNIGPVHNRNRTLKFKSHNRAKANILLYGHSFLSKPTMNTRISLFSNKWLVEDIR